MIRRIQRTGCLWLVVLSSVVTHAAPGTLNPNAANAVEAGARGARVAQLEKDAQQRPTSALSFELGQLSDLHASAFLLQAGNLQSSDQAVERIRLLSRYALAQRASADALEFATQYVEVANTDLEASRAQYVLAQAELLAGRSAAAGARMDWLSRHGHGEWRGWGLYGQGQCALAQHDSGEAVRLLKSAASLNNHEAKAPAMLMLGQIYEAQGRTQQAIRHFTMYRERYVRGIIPLIENVSGNTSQADLLGEVLYTIQVGVFGDRTNALKQKESFEARGHRVRLKAKSVGGQRYTAVWVGQYRSRDEAQTRRRALELSSGETYRVVVVE